MNRLENQPTAELLYLLHGDPAELQEMLSGLRSADIAEALRSLSPDAASKVMAALPFDLAVQVFDEPELEHHRFDVIKQIPDRSLAPLIEAMSADQQADLFRELPTKDRSRLLALLEDPTRRTLSSLLEYPPDTAGGIMTTEFVSVPATWTVDQTLRHIAEVGRAKETVYAIYVIDPESRQLVHVVSLRELVVTDRAATVLDVGDRRAPIVVHPHTDREEVSRLIAKYNLLALP
ncbi:MAG TPA: CBS domain-containing protein, partial [Gemmatimonadaceae bacterium]|nr:CBS domain-containing protein [Gemmatimonadaceae bacterium]